MTGTSSSIAVRPFADRLLAVADRRRWWIFGAILALYLAGFNGVWRVSPDSALYSSLGRNLAEGRGFSYQGVPHTWAEPGLPLLIAGSFRLAGEDHFGPVLAILLVCALIALAMNFWLVTLHAGRAVGVVVTTMLASCETFYRYAYHLFTDMPFLVGVLAFLVGYERLLRDTPRRRWVSWILMALAIPFMASFRPAILTFAGAVAVTVVWHLVRGPRRMQHVLVGAIVLAGLLAFRAVDPRRASVAAVDYREAKLKTLLVEHPRYAIHRALTEWTPMLLKETTTEGVIGTRIWIDPVASIVILALGIALVRRRVLWGVWVAATVAQMIVWLPRERYLLPILPLLFLSSWLAIQWVSRRRFAGAGISSAALLILLVGPNVVLVAVFALRQHKHPLPEGPAGAEYSAMTAFADRVGRAVTDRDLILATGARELSYFSRRRVIALPSAQRVPPTEAQWRTFWALLRSAEHVYVVLPDGRHGQLTPFIAEHHLDASSVPVVESDRAGKHGASEPWTLRTLTLPPSDAP